VPDAMTSRLAGKIALISGGSGGIGEATARRLVAEGASVMIADLPGTDGDQLAAELGANAAWCELDVTSEADWERAVRQCQEVFGGLSILVSNAGLMSVNRLEDTTAGDFRRTFDVNALGTFFGIKAVVPVMRANGGGAIVTVSSVAGTVGAPRMIAYGASKAANASIARSAAIELGPDQIRVNSVHPGVIDTAMSRGVRTSPPTPEWIAGTAPLQRLGEPEEVAAVIAFLASDDASYVSGSQYLVDGARLA
jgi:3alpha(or 20beta)-hydroxysteroid dehydrogenase